MRYYILMAMMLLLGAGSAKASAYDDTSVAGLFPVSNQGREVSTICELTQIQFSC